MLRLDWNLLLNIINLIILYALMKRFLFKPVNAILEKRRREARVPDLYRPMRRRRRHRKKHGNYDSLLEDAQSEKERIVTQAREEASTRELWPYREQMREG